MSDLTPINRIESALSGEPLTPMTRAEAIISGEDLEPMTRLEWFLKNNSGGSGESLETGDIILYNMGQSFRAFGATFITRIPEESPIMGGVLATSDLDPTPLYQDSESSLINYLIGSIVQVSPVSAGSGSVGTWHFVVYNEDTDEEYQEGSSEFSKYMEVVFKADGAAIRFFKEAASPNITILVANEKAS